MSFLKILSGGLLTLHVLFFYAVAAENPTTSNIPARPLVTGTITLINLKHPDQTCTYETEPSRIIPIFSGNPNSCGSVADSQAIELRNVPSATRIRLATNRDPRKECTQEFADSAPPVIELVTIKKSTTVADEPLKLADLRTLKPGDVVKPGLRFIRHELGTYSFITCLIIDASPLAP